MPIPRRFLALSVAALIPAIAQAQSLGTPIAAGAPIAADARPTLGPPIVGPGAFDIDTQAPANAVAPRFTIRHDVGNGPGFSNGYTYGEGFFPILQCPQNWIWFGNLRAVNFDDRNVWEYNAGSGARFFYPQINRIFGAYVQYDATNSQAGNFFSQVNVGVESLGCYLDFRANVYRTLGQDRFFLSDGFGNPFFRANNIILDRTLRNEVALNGVDAEIGGPVPYLQQWAVRAFVGYYNYSNSGADTISGVRGRLEATPHDRVSLHVSVQHDAVFHTTVHGGLALHFGPGRRTKWGPGHPVVDRLGDRVVRDPNIMVTTQATKTQVVATDPSTGAPIIVKHADSNAAAGGDGTFERPYQTLPTLQAGSAAGQILFVHTNSVFVNQGIALKNNQRFLGDGILHAFKSAQGNFFLPMTAGNTPVLQNVSVVGTGLANNNEVSGLRYESGNVFSVSGFGIQNFNVNRNTFTNSPAASGALQVQDATGSGIVANNTFVQTTLATPTNSGFLIQNTTGSLRVTITDNVTSDHNYAGGVLRTAGTGEIFATLRRNQFGETAAARLGLSAESLGGNLNLQFLNNTSTQGYRLEAAGGALRVENTLGTNVGPFVTLGAITTVPRGTFGFPEP